MSHTNISKAFLSLGLGLGLLALGFYQSRKPKSKPTKSKPKSKPSLRIPKFETEAAEAAWWYDHRHEIEAHIRSQRNLSLASRRKGHWSFKVEEADIVVRFVKPFSIPNDPDQE